MNIYVPISVGELIDKITILEIKSKKILDDEKLKNINYELTKLTEIYSKVIQKKHIDNLYQDLYNINLDLWNLEDQIREHESKGTFDQSFVNIARKIYKTNDQRSAVKKQINLEYNSYIIEEKSYKNL